MTKSNIQRRNVNHCHIFSKQWQKRRSHWMDYVYAIKASFPHKVPLFRLQL